MTSTVLLSSTTDSNSNNLTTAANFNLTVSYLKGRVSIKSPEKSRTETPVEPIYVRKFARLRYGNNDEIIFNIFCQVKK